VTELLQPVLAVISGAAVGFSLALIGGGGSILAVPLLLYVVGIRDPHFAIGTSALAVAANAFVNLANHWRCGTVRWAPALVFGITGAAGAAAGSTLAKFVDGQRLLFLFALVMIAAGICMLRGHEDRGTGDGSLHWPIISKLIATGAGAGLLSGFFGIGGGFLIVPGLVWAAGMPMINAVGSSLFSVGTFGLTTAVNYALSGLVTWAIAGEFLAGGALGGLFGMKLAVRLAAERHALKYVFAALIFVVAAYMLLRTTLQLTT
jgi:uncharacterized membrane protein YfcA